MVEGTFKSVDTLAYYVNNVNDFDNDIVIAYKRNDREKLKELAARGQGEYDVFICVTKQWHGFVLCVPAGIHTPFEEVITDVIKSQFDVDDRVLCYVFELCYDDENLRTYKIRKEMSFFRDIKNRVAKRNYFIGHYKQISPSGFQIAAMRAAPHRYAVLLKDCVEFSKEFCIQALAYCSNWRDIESEVKENIKRASATGFSFEQLSRKVRSSGWLGNIALGGTDIGSLLTRRNPNTTSCLIMVFLLIYPIIVFVIGQKVMNW